MDTEPTKIAQHKTIHLMGIGGSGMNPLAKILMALGYQVQGSDFKQNAKTLRLADEGAKVFFGHSPDNLRSADVVGVSTAIPKDNPEYLHAQSENIPIYRRAELLDLVMSGFQKRVSVCGTHGKTSTTAMIARLLTLAQHDPTYMIGGEFSDYGGSAQVGKGPYFVAESDESDGSFLALHPNIGILTNIEADHMEFFKEIDNLKSHFQSFLNGIIERDGYIVANADDPISVELTQSLPANKLVWYGIEKQADIMATDISHSIDGTRFKVVVDGSEQGEVLLKVHGRHNVYNALAVTAFARTEKLTLDTVKKGLFSFVGTNRRFQLIGHRNDVAVYDDYGHHPTEIQTTLEGIRNAFGARIICIFQPHRYTRTRDLLESFPKAFCAADEIIITEIYSANETKIEGVSGKLIVDALKDTYQKKARFIPKKGEIAHQIAPELRPDDLVITMGAGDIYTVAKELLVRLKSADD